MLKQLLMIMPLVLGSISAVSANEASNEVVTGQMRGYRGAGSHHSVEDLRATRNRKLIREREHKNGANGTFKTSIVVPVTNPVVVPGTRTPNPIVTPTTR